MWMVSGVRVSVRVRGHPLDTLSGVSGLSCQLISPTSLTLHSWDPALLSYQRSTISLRCKSKTKISLFPRKITVPVSGQCILSMALHSRNFQEHCHSYNFFIFYFLWKIFWGMIARTPIYKNPSSFPKSETWNKSSSRRPPKNTLFSKKGKKPGII